jgi:O-antigen ligase
MITIAAYASGANASGLLGADSFTGRGLIWELALNVMKNSSSLTGLGFQSVFQVGDASIFAGASKNYAFLATVSHAHNSYLEVFISIGLIGCVFAFFAIMLAPIRRLLRLSREHDSLRPVCFSIILFCYLQSLLESELLNRDSIVWISLLLAYAIICSAHEIEDERTRAYRVLALYPQQVDGH